MTLDSRLRDPDAESVRVTSLLVTSPPEPRRVLVVGHSTAPQWPAIREAVETVVPRPQIRHVPTVDDAARLDTDWHPDLVLVSQQWTHEYTDRDVLALLRAFPLARFVCCYGPWCDSDGRSGTPWPPAVRVAPGEAAARIGREVDVLDGRRTPLPLTASRDEIFAFDHSG